MQLSARNQLNATVDAVNHGEVMSTVGVQPCPTASRSPRRGGGEEGHHQGRCRGARLAPGDAVVVVIKATEVMLAKS